MIYIVSDESIVANKLKELCDKNSLRVTICTTLESLDSIVKHKPIVAICINSMSDQNTSGASSFIIKASQAKVFQHTAFALLEKDPVNEMSKIQGMTLGYSLILEQKLDELDQDRLINFINAEIAYFKNKAA